MRVEAEAMRWAHALCPDSVPDLVWYDPVNHVLAMPLLRPPHQALTDAIRGGKAFPGLAEKLADLLSTLFVATSEAVMGPAAHSRAVMDFANEDIVTANEQVVLVGPFSPEDPDNSWLQELEGDVRALWEDEAAMASVAHAVDLYRSSTECLIHNDLHTGNLIVAPGSTWLVDWEFATFGPAAYDLGSLIASLILAAIAAASLPGSGRAEQRAWLLATAEDVWALTTEQWWRKRGQQRRTGARGGASDDGTDGGGSGGGGGGSSSSAGSSSSGITVDGSRNAGGMVVDASASREAWEALLLADTLAFAGCCMCRLVVGRHSYQLFAEMGAATPQRVASERAALRIGRELLAGRQAISSMREALENIAAQL